jgi:DNA-binding Lrp family transcriptional regulator
MSQLDELDRKILRLLQEDCDISLDALAKEVGSSKTPVWPFSSPSAHPNMTTNG